MSLSSWNVFYNKSKTIVYFTFCIVVMGCFIPTFATISLFVWIVAYFFSTLDPTLGRFTRYLDTWIDENFTDNVPKGSIVTTITLGGHMSLEQLKSLFITNVLQATLSTKSKKIRYPELQQYLTSFMGFRVWKNNPSFSIDDHIIQHYEEGILDIQSIHQNMINKPYHKNRSPWEIVLINSTSGVSESIIVARCHHVMIDGRSILKMFVECLGQKPLKTAQATTNSWNFITSCKFYLLFPFRYSKFMLRIFYKTYTVHTHPWKHHSFRTDINPRLNVAFSPILKLSDLKRVGKSNKVSTSSVIMCLVSGAIRNSGVNLAKRDITIGYPMPKENHPEYISNHLHMTILPLPTDEMAIGKRLYKCNEIFRKAKVTNLGTYTNIIAIQGGLLIYPFSKSLTCNHFLPMFLTNIAGEEEGFSVGGYECTDFRMSVGPLEGVASVTFCVFSYKDDVHVGIVAKENMITKEETEKLASDIELELKALLSH